jgi:hypothetical protein
MISAEAAAQKWAQRMGSASTNYIQGIQSVQVNPMEMAAKNVAAYQAGVNAAVASGKYVNRLRAVPQQHWVDQCIKLGAQRIGAGATQAQPKVLAFLQQFLPAVAQAQARVKAMPNDTYEARKARAMAMMDALHAFKRS